MTPEDRRHGTPTGYTDGRCRQTCCRDAVARAWNLYEMRRAANHGQPLTISKTGAVRRLQALMAIGWPRRELSRRAGYTADALTGVLNGRRQTLLLDTHRRVADLYESLSGTPGPSTRSRKIAANRGWASPLAWDGLDIDDPSATPDFGSAPNDAAVDEVIIQRVLAGDASVAPAATRAERVLIVQRWTALGRPLNELRRLTGWKTERYQRKEGTAA